jgi:hypothetical protein
LIKIKNKIKTFAIKHGLGHFVVLTRFIPNMFILQNAPMSEQLRLKNYIPQNTLQNLVFIAFVTFCFSHIRDMGE